MDSHIFLCPELWLQPTSKNSFSFKGQKWALELWKVSGKLDLNLTLKNWLILLACVWSHEKRVTAMALSQQLCPLSNLQASGEEPVYRLGWMDGLFIGWYLPACGVMQGTLGGWGRAMVWREVRGGLQRRRKLFYALASVSVLLKLSYRLLLVCRTVACRKSLNWRCCIYWTTHKSNRVKSEALQAQPINILFICDSQKAKACFICRDSHMLVLVIWFVLLC